MITIVRYYRKKRVPWGCAVGIIVPGDKGNYNYYVGWSLYNTKKETTVFTKREAREKALERAVAKMHIPEKVVKTYLEVSRQCQDIINKLEKGESSGKNSNNNRTGEPTVS